MARPKLKPNYDYHHVLSDLLEQVVLTYKKVNSSDHASLAQVGAALDINPLKVRKLLITAGVYESPIADEVNSRYTQGESVPQIMEALHLSRASVHSYLPYTRVVYKTKEISAAAERNRVYRKRMETVNDFNDRIERPMECMADGLHEPLWNTLVRFQDYPFETAKGLRFRYRIKGNEMFVDRKEKSITRATVEVAFHNAIEQDRNVSGPKKLGTFGASYLYPIFKRIGVVRKDP